MTRGVYIVANDRVADNAIALMSSIRLHEPDLPVVMIPFNEDCHQVERILTEKFQVQLFPDLPFLEEFTQLIGEIFPRDFLKLPNKMRKLAAWFGPLEEFLYVDTDIVVFRPLLETLNFLKDADFITCDFHHKGRGLADVFSEAVPSQNIFTSEALKDVFNSGFWGARRGSLSLETMKALLRECAAHREYFDFSSGTTDQPILNYLVLKGIERRLNIVRVNPQEPGSWGGSTHFVERDHILYDGDCPLRYLHWAGTPMRSGAPYRELWEYYRYLDYANAIVPTTTSTASKSSVQSFLKQYLPFLFNR
ncbi:Npun_R2821/Npun_R2822 family protein [Leptolyngbya sp. PCC 6406]|uniref:Npun_R2821/Npun_R2822 family protein n=1 Tax=Leptolyngbya sp. PCC 6406 TaxID=1173264 RepID=UPI0002AC30F9|nr:Npun_R2821/Npun_R2822 family protein [Leptolyngbya sp. PCC 6406]